MDIGPLQGSAVLAAVDKGPAHHELHRLRQVGVLEQDHRGQAAGPGKKKLVEVVGLLFVDGSQFAAAGNEEDPHVGIIDAFLPELPVVQPHHRGEARQARHQFLQEAGGAGGLRGAAEPELIPPEDGGAAHPGHHDGRGVVGQDRGHRAVGRFARNKGDLLRHGAEMRHRHIHFHGGRGAGSADIFGFRLHQVVAALLQTVCQFL